MIEIVAFLAVARCVNPRCRAAFVGPGGHCAGCQRTNQRLRDIATGKSASKRDVVEHKRLSLRRRLGLLA